MQWGMQPGWLWTHRDAGHIPEIKSDGSITLIFTSSHWEVWLARERNIDMIPTISNSIKLSKCRQILGQSCQKHQESEYKTRPIHITQDRAIPHTSPQNAQISCGFTAALICECVEMCHSRSRTPRCVVVVWPRVNTYGKLGLCRLRSVRCV